GEAKRDDATDARRESRLAGGEDGEGRTAGPPGEQQRDIGSETERADCGIAHRAVLAGELRRVQRRSGRALDPKERPRADAGDGVAVTRDLPPLVDGGAEPAPVAAGVDDEDVWMAKRRRPREVKLERPAVQCHGRRGFVYCRRR